MGERPQGKLALVGSRIDELPCRHDQGRQGNHENDYHVDERELGEPFIEFIVVGESELYESEKNQWRYYAAHFVEKPLPGESDIGVIAPFARHKLDNLQDNYLENPTHNDSHADDDGGVEESHQSLIVLKAYHT